MKKMALILAALLLAAGLAGCGAKAAQVPPDTQGSAEQKEAGQEEKQDTVEITLWTYPVGGWGDSTSVSNLIADFNRENPEIKVNVECMDYDSGDQKIAEAIEKNMLPDLVFEGPERLVANWGDKGLMADVSDLWESDAASQIDETVKTACRHRNGSYYEFPVCMTAHCMCINYEMFKEAGALKYIDEENHTWSTEDFVKAVKALYDSGQEKIGIVYCGGQGGDQGTRALVNNLYSGSFANADHTGYEFDSEENIRALQLLKDLDGITFDPESQGTDEIRLFGSGELAMAFCWNVSQDISQTVSNPNLDFDFFPMAFPTSDGNPTLQGGIWGFGIFDNGDAARIEAAKKFIRFMTEDDVEYAKAVTTSYYWPVRDMPGLYENDDIMTEYGIFTRYLGDYYQVTPGWADVRTAWWTMLQEIASGKEIKDAAAAFDQTANAAAQAAMENDGSAK